MYLIGKKAEELGAEIKYDLISYDPKTLRGFIQRYNFKEWQEELERRENLTRWCNSRVLVNCDSNPNYAQGIENSEKRVTEFNKKVIGPYKEVLYRKGKNTDYEVKWNIVAFPSREQAKAAGMTLREYEDFVYSATLENNWKKMNETMRKIKELFDNVKDVHIHVPRLTDLHLSLSGRGGELCCGKLNMPDGEICYGPIEDSTNGLIYFQCPTKREGLGEIKGIKLKFANGNIVEYSAKENQRALEKTLDIDEGAKRIGEFGIGCNNGIRRITLETLFDEKIAGTIHLALGDSFKEQPLNRRGGLNKSNIHWDIICDLRRDKNNLNEFPGGEILVDGKLAQKNGEWLI